MSSSSDHLYSLCDYGVDRSLSAQLMTKYGDEDDIPLFEFDKTEFNRTMEV